MCASPSGGLNSSTELHAEVCVVGAGPAGAACALRLARLGHDVLLVDRAPRGRAHVGESLPASVLPLLQEMGVRRAVEQAGFLRPRGALVQWGEAAQRDEREVDEPGFQVDRGRFDALLADAAVAAGARWLQAGAMPAQPTEECVCVPLRDGRRVQARWLVLAQGRRAAEPSRGPRTAALYAYWEGVRFADPRTRVEAAAQAWYWGAPLPDGSFNATVFVDAARCARLQPAQREALYRHLLGASALLRECTAGRARAPVQVCDATPRVDPMPVQGRVLKVGEAAFSIDPLASQGVQAALRSGWQAAACVHTAVHRPASQWLAAEFHASQVERTASRHARLAAGFHAEAARRFGSVFWRERAAAFEPVPVGLALPPLHAHVSLALQARLAPTPAIEGDFVVQAEALHHPALDSPVSHVGALPVARLLQPLRGSSAVGALLQQWRSDCGEAGAVQLFAQWWRQGVVVPAVAPA